MEEDILTGVIMFTGTLLLVQTLQALRRLKSTHFPSDTSLFSEINTSSDDLQSCPSGFKTVSRKSSLAALDVGKPSGSSFKAGNVRSSALCSKTLIPYSNERLPDTVVVDCTHPTAFQLTHHLKDNTEKQRLTLLHGHTHRNLRGDTSTDAVLNAIHERDAEFQRCKYVCSNHFDIDSFLGVFCCVNPHIAVKHEQLLRLCARIGDFRELQLSQTDDADSDISDCALRVVCWLNSAERSKFSLKPFEAAFSAATGESGAMEKFRYFLDNFSFALEHIQAPLLLQEYEEEYYRVLDEYQLLHFGMHLQRNKNGVLRGFVEANAQTSHQRFPGLGLCIVRAVDPVHYYSLFSLTLGYDIVLSCYRGNRYELELKYTTYIDLISRRSRPRVDLSSLARQLNRVERSYRQYACDHDSNSNNNGDVSSAVDGSVDGAAREGIDLHLAVHWIADCITDSGPLLRLENIDGPKLTKAERYGHPYERPVLSSAIPCSLIEQLVVSYFEFAYRVGDSCCKAKKDWTWSEIHAFNRAIDWSQWDKRVSDIVAASAA